MFFRGIKRPILLHMAVSCYAYGFTRQCILHSSTLGRHHLTRRHFISITTSTTTTTTSQHYGSKLYSSSKSSIHISPDYTLKESINYCEKVLVEAGDSEASSSAMYLVAHAIGEVGSKAVSILGKKVSEDEQQRQQASVQHQKLTLKETSSLSKELPKIGSEAAAKLNDILKRRADREPLQYILGEVF
jgi:hypothetical protein